LVANIDPVRAGILPPITRAIISFATYRRFQRFNDVIGS
jgi:hypothetical protein